MSPKNHLKLIQYSLNNQYCLTKLNEKSGKTTVYMHLFLSYKNSDSLNIGQWSIRFLSKNNQWKITLSESYFTICHSARVFSQVSIAMKKNKLFTPEIINIQNRYQLQWRKTNYSNQKIIKVQNWYQLKWRKNKLLKEENNQGTKDVW